MKKHETEAAIEIIKEHVVKYLPKKYHNFYKKLFTYQEHLHAYKTLVQPITEMLAARALISEELWANYKLFQITGLPEQQIFEEAVEKVTKTIKELENAPKEKPKKAPKRVPLAKQKSGV